MTWYDLSPDDQNLPPDRPHGNAPERVGDILRRLADDPELTASVRMAIRTGRLRTGGDFEEAA